MEIDWEYVVIGVLCIVIGLGIWGMGAVGVLFYFKGNAADALGILCIWGILLMIGLGVFLWQMR